MFEIACQEDRSLRALITVNDIGNTSETTNDKLKPLLYTHVTLMGLVFGVLLPIGAYLAYHYFTIVHVVVQAISMLAALLGLIMVVVYVELTHGKHFQFPIHGAIGMGLLLFMLIMPLLRLHKTVKIFHPKLGHVIVFFGMTNVIVVSYDSRMIRHYDNFH